LASVLQGLNIRRHMPGYAIAGKNNDDAKESVSHRNVIIVWKKHTKSWKQRQKVTLWVYVFNKRVKQSL